MQHARSDISALMHLYKIDIIKMSCKNEIIVTPKSALHILEA